MKKLLKSFERSIIFLIKFVMLSLCYLLFYGLYFEAIPSLSRITSQISIISVFIFAITGLLFIRIYGGFAIGEKKSKEITHSLILAAIMTDLITFAVMCMVEKAILPVTPLFIIVVAQYLIIGAAARVGNGFHFALHPPDSTLIIYGDESKLPVYEAKIGRYKKQWKVNEQIPYNLNLEDPEEILFKRREAIRRHAATFVVDVPPTEAAIIVEYCYKHNRKVFLSPSVADIINNTAKHYIIDDITVYATTLSGLSFEQMFIKRVIDIVFSFLGIILSSPFLIIAALLVAAGRDGPIFYRQRRMTRGGKTYNVLKFRTMRTDAEKDSGAVLSEGKDDPRVTRAGKILRKLRLDELPQFFNILKGDMSIVGPRPEREEIAGALHKDHPEFQYRLKVKAGLTGLAQIRGKYNTDLLDKLNLDLVYINSYSIWLDIKLVLQTFVVLLKPDSTEGVKPPSETEQKDEA
jgi:exopolysaccharide biosynthesis polyprenyl glycosylphosphotransferase